MCSNTYVLCMSGMTVEVLFMKLCSDDETVKVFVSYCYAVG